MWRVVTPVVTRLQEDTGFPISKAVSVRVFDTRLGPRFSQVAVPVLVTRSSKTESTAEGAYD